MFLQLDILCDNTVGRPIAAHGEHGFSCLVSTVHGRWLFDTGSGSTLLNNFSVLGYSSDNLDGVILSHGHYDHCGGLMPLLLKTGKQTIYTHSGIFKERYWLGEHEQRIIGIPYSRQELESAGADFVFLDNMTEIVPDMFFSGPIPRESLFETGDPRLVEPGSEGLEYCPDAFDDDAALALRTDKGLVILLGCAHAGMVNTVEYFRSQLSAESVYAIIGGTHLGPVSDEQFAATADYLDTINPARIGLSHCTGQNRAAQLYSRFPNKVFFANVGTTVKV